MRKTYDKEFKVKVAKDIINELTTVGQVSKDFGVTRPMVSRWVAEYKRYKSKAFTGRGKRLPDKAKLYTLEQENKRLKEENEMFQSVRYHKVYLFSNMSESFHNSR